MNIIKPFLSAAFALLILPSTASAEDTHHHDHGGQIFHAITIEADYGAGDAPVARWDAHGWIGTDEDKLVLIAEGEREDGTTEEAEFQALYSRNVSEFWDAQLGLRHDTQPASTSYLAAGVSGLAPYFIETDAHVFVSDDGDVSARLTVEREILLTQRLILTPEIEADVFAQDVPEQDTGAGLATAEAEIQLRYEISRKCAPYISLRHERKFGETSSIAKASGEDNHDTVAAIGWRVMF